MVNPTSGGDSTLVDEFLSSGAANTRPMAAPTTSAQGHTLYNSGSEEEDLSGGNALVGSGAPGNLRGSLNSSPTSGGLADELSQPLLSRQASSQNAQGTNTTTTTNTNTAATGMNSSSGSTPIGLMTQQQQQQHNNNNTVQEGGNASGPLFLDSAGMTHVVALQRLFVLMIEAQEIITRLQQFGYFPGKQFMADDPSGAVQMLVSLMTASMQATNSTPANTMMGGGNEGGSGSNSPHRMASPNTLLSNVGLGGTQGTMNPAQLPAMPPPPGMSGMPSALQMNPLPCATSAPAALQQGGNAFFPFGTNTNNGRNSAAGAANPFFDMSGGNPNAAAGGGGMMNTTTTAGGGTNEDGIGQDPNAMWAFPPTETNAATQPNQLDALLARAHEQQQQQRAGAYGMMNNYAKPGLMSMMGNHPGANTTHDEMGGKSGLDSPHFDPNFMSSTGANAGGSGRNSHQNSSHSRHGRGSRNQRRNKGANGGNNNAGAEGQGMFGDEAGNEGNANTTPAAAHNNNNNNNNNAGLNPAEAVLAAGGIMACVEFKRGRIRKYACDLPDITPGAYVLVDGDRGTDCGLLVQTARMLPNGMKSVTCMDGCDVKDEKLKLENGRVLRPASDDDIDRLHNIIANAEAVALKTCRQRCLELGIDIELVDVEYQFDMKKISFFFNCDHSVDFRALVRELYRTFGARIWMENINPKVKNAMPYPNEQNGAGQEGEGMTSGGGNNRGHHGGYRRRN